jgi:hypothetical protein
MRNVWTVRGDKIASYEVIHDADRLRAFFRLVSGRRRASVSPHAAPVGDGRQPRAYPNVFEKLQACRRRCAKHPKRAPPALEAGGRGATPSASPTSRFGEQCRCARAIAGLSKMCCNIFAHTHLSNASTTRACAEQRDASTLDAPSASRYFPAASRDLRDRLPWNRRIPRTSGRHSRAPSNSPAEVPTGSRILHYRFRRGEAWPAPLPTSPRQFGALDSSGQRRYRDGLPA